MIDGHAGSQGSPQQPVLVLGGTGQLGRTLVDQLLASGWHVRVLSRKPGRDPRVHWVLGDLVTGEGLDVALTGVSHVIHAATNSPIARRGAIRTSDLWSSPADVDVGGTQRALDAAQENTVEHFLFVSIVGLEDSKLPYSRVKLAGEELVRTSDLSWSVVRATPFFYLIERMLSGLHRWPLWPLPNAPFQPVDTRDVAAHVIQCLQGTARGILPEVGGPEITSYSDMARAHLSARAIKRPVLAFSLPARLARQGGMVVTNGVRGACSWERWLSEQTAGIQ